MTYPEAIAAIKCDNCPLRPRAAFTPLAEAELNALSRFKKGEMVAQPGTQLFVENSRAAHLYTVLSGMGVRYVTSPTGRRQVIGFVLPGEFAGLQASVMGAMRHAVEASTTMRLCVFNRSQIFDFFAAHPERAFALTYHAAMEEHLLGDALATVGHLPATELIAWSLHRFYARAESLDLAERQKCPLPFRQRDLADALGLSLVHTNKTLARLKANRIAEWSEGELRILDLERLRDLSGLEPHFPAPRPLF